MSYPWRPFIDPIDVALPQIHDYWFLLLFPISLGIAVAYKAVRAQDMKTYPREVLIMTGQIVLGMIMLALAAYLFLTIVLPRIAP